MGFKFKYNKHSKKNLYQQKKEFGIAHKKAYITAYGKLYFVIKEFLGKIKKEGRELEQKDREELLQIAAEALRDNPIYNVHKHKAFTDKALSYVLGLLILHGDLPSTMVKQLEILLEHDVLYEEAKEGGDLRLARDLNKDRMEVYKLTRRVDDRSPAPSNFLGVKIGEDGKGVLAMGTPEECLHMVKQALMPSAKKMIESKMEVKLNKEDVIEVLPKGEQ